MGSCWEIFIAVAVGGRPVVRGRGPLPLLQLLLLLLPLLLLPLLLLLTSKLLLLIVQIEFVNQAIDFILGLSLFLVFVGGCAGAGPIQFLKSNVLNSVTINVLVGAETIKETFLLVDLDNGKVVAALSTGNETSGDNVLQ